MFDPFDLINNFNATLARFKPVTVTYSALVLFISMLLQHDLNITKQTAKENNNGISMLLQHDLN